MLDRKDADLFEIARPKLLGLAYRILGSAADAEDAVQDSFVKWVKADRGAIENQAAWLMTTCTRRCLDLLRSAHRARVEYVGAWLPEPIHTPVENGAVERLELDASLTTAFLLMLERLTPKERAAYLLHDIFEMSYAEIAEILEVRESACRKLVSRAKANIDKAKVRHTTSLEQQDRLLTAFKDAISEGATEKLAALLSDDVELSADGGGKVPAILEELKGRAEVVALLSQKLNRYWAGQHWRILDLNGSRGFVLKRDDAITAAVSFAFGANGEVTGIYIMRNPDKLASLGRVALH